MARSRRGGGRADWVYRGIKHLLDDPTVDEDAFSGSYYNPIALSAGASTAQVLYDSEDYMGGRYATSIVAATGAPDRYNIPSPGRPDEVGGGPLIMGCDLVVNGFIQASQWTGNGAIYLALRVIVAHQDVETGQAALDVNYSMWQNFSGFETGEPVYFANGRQNCWERRIWRDRRSTDTNLNIVLAANPRFRRRLAPDEALFLYCELHPSSLSLPLLNLFCRTLVRDTRN